MALNTPFYPYAATNASNSFSVQSNGLIQGTAFNDPATRFALAIGTLSASATQPIWGGVPITESIASGGTDNSLGGSVIQASSVANITGFAVQDQGYSWVQSPQSRVPSIGAAGMSVPFYRLGSRARIVVAMDPSLGAALSGGSTSAQVSWDFNNQCLQPYDASTATISLTSITSSYANGVYTFAVVASAATTVGAVGDFINVSGVTGTGASLVNGNQTVTAFTDNQHFSFQVTAASGAIATGSLSGTLVLNQGTGALPVQVLQVNNGNSLTISYNPTTGACNWNRNGSAAIILL